MSASLNWPIAGAIEAEFCISQTGRAKLGVGEVVDTVQIVIETLRHYERISLLCEGKNLRATEALVVEVGAVVIFEGWIEIVKKNDKVELYN